MVIKVFPTLVLDRHRRTHRFSDGRHGHLKSHSQVANGDTISFAIFLSHLGVETLDLKTREKELAACAAERDPDKAARSDGQVQTANRPSRA
jgi:hypothetical protein